VVREIGSRVDRDNVVLIVVIHAAHMTSLAMMQNVSRAEC
jgi:hypothetical protein